MWGGSPRRDEEPGGSFRQAGCDKMVYDNEYTRIKQLWLVVGCDKVNTIDNRLGQRDQSDYDRMLGSGDNYDKKWDIEMKKAANIMRS